MSKPSKPSKHRDIVKLLEANARSSSILDVFRDFNELAALSIANAVDLRQFQQREERYLSIIGRYKPDEQKRFPEIFARLVEAMEEERGDVMGSIMGELNLGNAARGQFFTPYHLCQAIARITADPDTIRGHIADKGFITVNEPAVGGGAMVIAFAEAMQDAGINYQQHLHVVAQDVDPRSVHMAYVQFSLLHIPATVILGNTIALEDLERWHTPAHFLGLWENKLRRGYALGSAMDSEASPPAANEEKEERAQVLASAPIADFHMQGDLFGAFEEAA